MGLYQRVLGHPFVYNRIRPLAVGGLDMTPFYDRVAPNSEAIVLDIGCGTGDALRHISSFARYFGIDTDETAIQFARRAHTGIARASFECRRCDRNDFEQLRPTHVLLAGVLHHVDDREAEELLRLALLSPGLQRVVTSDIVFLPGEHISNLLARLDRGRHCRREPEYKRLAEKAGLRVVESAIVRSHPRGGLAKYLMMTLEP